MKKRQFNRGHANCVSNICNYTVFSRIIGFIFIVVSFSLWPGAGFANTLQDFEDGSLSGWTVGGRQWGTGNWWGVTEYAGSKMAYLHHRSFTELSLSKSFTYFPGMVLSFDAEFSINGDTSPTPSGNSDFFDVVAYGIGLIDSDGNQLNYIAYLAATTYYPTNINEHHHVFRPNGIEHYVHDISELASELNVDIGEVDKVHLWFWGYSSWWSNSDMIVRFDNVATETAVPLPGAVWLLGSGILGFWGLKKRIESNLKNTSCNLIEKG